MERTTIQLSEKTADRLYERKGRGETYDDVVVRLLDQTDKPQEGAEIKAGGSADVDDHPTPEPEETTIDAPDIDDSEDLAEADFPSNLDRDRCIEATHAARELIREEGGATKKEIVQRIMPEYHLGYDVDGALAKIEAGERYRGAWWRRVIKPAFEAFPDVQKPKRGASKWKYRQNSE